MAAFILKSDHQFVTPRTNADLLVFDFEHMGDMNTTALQTNERGALLAKRPAVRVGPSSEQHKALQVFGVTIDGEQLGGLARELSGIEDGNNVYVYVNRLGLCVVTKINHPQTKSLRVNDCFGWSKYGVRVPREMICKPTTTTTLWNRLDMFNGETMMDVGGMVRATEEAEELRRSLEEARLELAACKKELEEKKVDLTTREKELEEEKKVELTACNEELEEKKVELTTCKKELEEKKVELTTREKEVEEKKAELTACRKEVEEEKVELAACRKELEWCKRMESDHLSKSLVEEKNKKAETLEDQELVASKAALNKRRFFCF
ncbi:unnamed protein product [Linum trigynum]|uniref:Uncharacterized protein n=1 Tax=Linum trigynum TaxID=586398 RepID=A0AAV2FIY6_9ROSI